MAAPEDLVTREGEDPWTEAEVAEVHEELTRRAEELRAELAELDADLDGLIRGGGEGTGQDSADVGSASSERDQEISLVNNARTMLHQTERALERLAAGSFGVCEECGEPIGKMRVMAFPRATLCLSCKQREERR
ncbi:TraR/DksA family transcriptional regulator [Nocardioidaceae bacterium]|nr:TraR/DksA family transcriptional regulator [Nocardioidaceae bacterium]